MAKEPLKGITPSNLKKCQIFKTVKKNQSSVRITRQTLDSLYNQSQKVGKEAEIILTLPISDTEIYRIICSIQRVDQIKGDINE